MSAVHPSVAAVLAMLAEMPVDKRSVAELGPDLARARTRTIWADYWSAEKIRIHRVSDHMVETAKRLVPVRLYDPDAAGQPPILYFHGGGFVVGDLDTHDAIPRRLALYSGCPVISVDYVRAPEHPYPEPLEDCVAVAEAVAANAAGLDIDGSVFGLAGDSAGANLALGAAMRLRDGGRAAGAAVLFFGNFDPAMSGESHRLFASGYGLASPDVAWFWRQYLGDRIARPPADAAQISADLHGLPPLFVGAAECDPIRDDSVSLANRLAAIGARHEFRLWRGMIHGCVGMARMLNQADRQIAEAAVWVAGELARARRAG